jgi:hypothetical protein
MADGYYRKMKVIVAGILDRRLCQSGSYVIANHQSRNVMPRFVGVRAVALIR